MNDKDKIIGAFDILWCLEYDKPIPFELIRGTIKGLNDDDLDILEQEHNKIELMKEIHRNENKKRICK